MLLLIAGAMFGFWLLNGAPRLGETGSDSDSDSDDAVQVYVDGKRADAYVMESREER